jgi:hypothetical protein
MALSIDSSSAILVAVICGVAILVFLLNMARRRRARGATLYVRRPLSGPEQVLYFRLRAALPECIVLAQVEISRVLGIKNGPGWLSTRNALRGMSLDYVICLKDSSVVCAIELDDSSHDTPRGRLRHEKKTRFLEAAKLPLVRWRTRDLPSVEAIRQAIAS